MTWLPGYEVIVMNDKTGRTPDDPARELSAPGRICLHCTETKSLPRYPWPPNLTIGYVGPGSFNKYPGDVDGEPKLYQHISLDNTSYALKGGIKDPSGNPVPGNHMGADNIQIEIVTYLNDVWRGSDGVIRQGTWNGDGVLIVEGNDGRLPDALYEVVAQTLADIVTAIPYLREALDNFSGKWPSKWDTATWRDPFGGKPFIYQHRQVPLPNTHTDCQGIDVARVCLRAKQLLGDRKVTRIAGANRYETAAAVSREVFPGGSDVVWVATGANFPDALAAATAGDPLLLTTRDFLPPDTAAEIIRLGATRAFIVGGSDVVSDAVMAEVENLLA